MRTSLKRRIPVTIINEQLLNLGLTLYKYNKDIPITSQKFSVYDKDGYYYEVYWSAISKNVFPKKFHKANPYTIMNINHFLSLHHNDEYVCISKKFDGNNKQLEFVHLPCMKHFTSSLVAFQGKKTLSGDKYYKHCPYCYRFKVESYHASVLKQIFQHEYPDTIVEEKSCINPNTKRILPTDIVNHRLKMVIEIQSDYHDAENKQKLDSIKRNFWVDKGYRYYCPDIRDFSVMEMIQLFFPYITEIPSYINIHYSDANNPQDVQRELNNGFTIKEVSERLTISVATIHNMIASESVKLPESSKRKALKMKSLVHLTKNGNFIKEYAYLNEVSKDGYALGTIQRVLKGIQKYAYDSYWVYGEDYHSGKYNIPEVEEDICLLPIYVITNGVSEYYDSTYKASTSLSCHPCEIKRVLIGDRKSFRGYSFVFA